MKNNDFSKCEAGTKVINIETEETGIIKKISSDGCKALVVFGSETGWYFYYEIELA